MQSTVRIARVLAFWAVRFGCYVLNLLGCGWVMGDLSAYSGAPWPSVLWFLATMLGVIISIRPPRGIGRHVTAFSVLVVFVICGRIWFVETPAPWLFVLALPLLASMVVLEGPSFIRGAPLRGILGP